MAKKIALEIVSPERLVSKDEADLVVLPAVDGEIGVLPGHAPMLARLAAGELRIVKGAETVPLAVSGGFVQVHPDKVEVFAETAEMAKEIDVERARLAAERAKKELSKAATPQDMAAAQAALRRALIRLRVSEGLSKRLHKR